MFKEGLICALAAVIVVLLQRQPPVRQCPVCHCAALETRPARPNTAFAPRLQERARQLERPWLVNEEPKTDEERASVVDRMEHWERYVDTAANASAGWKAHLDRTTPLAFQGRASLINCSNVAEIGINSAAGWSVAKEERAVELLVECGFVQLNGFFSTKFLQEWREAFVRFRDTDKDAPLFRYPVQGKGRSEYLLPFREPFNSSLLYSDERLHNVLSGLFLSRFKLELQTVINSHAGSGNQRWHQGFQYLFHPEERLPPFAVVVAVPLVDVSLAMGPTHICPRKTLRFYQGYSCPSSEIAFESRLGDMVIFNYKTLHRGPANLSSEDRPMISMVFSKLFFLNQEAITNRAVPLVQTLTQRRYWEQFFVHPEKSEEMWRV
jgi:hypothetical protein